MGQCRNYSQTSNPITTSASTVAVMNKDRTALILFNTGAVSVLIGIGTALIPIAAGSHLAFTDEDAPQNAITAATASGTSTLVVWEA